MSSSFCCPTEVLPNKDATYQPKNDKVYIAGIGNSKGILFAGDIFGPHPNTYQVADTLAAKGFLVVMPDFFRGRHWPVDQFPPPGGRSNPEFRAFLQTLQYDRERVLQGITILRALGATSIGAAGFCWGATVAARACADGLVQSIALAHASTTCTPEVVSRVRGPVCLCPSKDDGDQLDLKDAIETKAGQAVTYRHFDTTFHGFVAARANFDDPENLKLANECLDLFAKFFNDTL